MLRVRLLLVAVAAATLLLALLPSSVQAGEVRWPCEPGTPTVMCFADPCLGITTAQCPLGCAPDNCGSCQARCYCRGSLDCPKGGRCRREPGATTGICSNFAPTAAEASAATPATVEKTADLEDELCKRTIRHGRGGRRSRCLSPTQEEPVVDGAADTETKLPAEPVDKTANDTTTVDTKCMTVRCNADTTCVEGACVPRNCTLDNDCSEHAFCNKESVCQPRSRCTVPDDCPAQDWFPLIKCVGHYTCEEGECGYKCGPKDDEKEEDAPKPQEPKPEPLVNGGAASCAVVLCPADSYCVDGQCISTSTLRHCNATSECDEASYCGAVGTCVARGTCERPKDCANDPTFVHIMCAPGVFSCVDKRCGYTCTSAESADP